MSANLLTTPKGFLLLLLTLSFHSLFAQAVGNVDAAALLDELPKPPADWPAATARVYPDHTNTPQTAGFYQPWQTRLETAAQQIQSLTMDFYRRYPTGVRPSATVSSNVSAAQQSAMDAATTELAQKMMNDPAFAQDFARKSEAEQQAYITQLLAQKGIQPAKGNANTPSNMPPGLDIDWAGMCTELMHSSADPNRWAAQTALQQHYAARHAETDAWAEAEIKKLPMISFGEYGHDHDPEKVKAIREEAARRHRQLGEEQWKEALPLLAQYRREALGRIAPLNDALKKVDYGKSYDFGIHYPMVLKTQEFLLKEAYELKENEIRLMEECAAWKFWR